jgi:hypothetical protein
MAVAGRIAWPLGSALRFAILGHPPLLHLLHPNSCHGVPLQSSLPHGSRANFLELFCGRDFDSRRRLLTGESLAVKYFIEQRLSFTPGLQPGDRLPTAIGKPFKRFLVVESTPG